MDIRADEYARYTLREGDLLVCEGGEVGRAAILSRNDSVLGFQKALHRLELLADRKCRGFFTTLFSGRAGMGFFWPKEIRTPSLILPARKLRRYRFPKPPGCEQRAIADFLDTETAKLDTLVGKKQELIEKLKEKRSALISRTITRGLPPEAARAAGLSMSVNSGKPKGRDPESRGDGKDWDTGFRRYDR